MKTAKWTLITLLFMFYLFFNNITAQDQTVGLFINETESFEGYTLFAPQRSNMIYLIDNDGREVHSWDTVQYSNQAVYLAENGNLFTTSNPQGNDVINVPGASGLVREFDWDGNLIWSFELNNDQFRLHHDIEVLPNGNVLMIAWENKSDVEAINQGRNPDLLVDGALWPDYIIEVQPVGDISGTIVWEWHSWDHLIQDFNPSKPNYGVVAEHPELIDLNYSAMGNQNGNADWHHTNGIDYNEELDQIILSVHNFCEFWVIDHSTSVDEASGHSGGNSGKGGDLLYRWGNPEAYESGSSSDQKLFGQHDVQWIKTSYPGEGNILVFNNGIGRPEGNYSTVDEIVPSIDEFGNYTLPEIGEPFEPNDPAWIYQAPDLFDFYSQNISGAQRLENGNTLICEGATGTFFEVTYDSEIVWMYVNPVIGSGPLHQDETIPGGQHGQENSVFKIRRYAPDYPGFDGVTLVPGDYIELPADNDETYYYPLVDTGQILFYDNQNEITEPMEGYSFYGQDANFEGNQPSYTNNDDGTITDNVTGLMWQQSPELNGDGIINSDDKLSYDEALDGADSFNLAGYDDWRLPTIKELYSLIMFSGLDCSGYEGNNIDDLTPFIDTDYFEFGYGDVEAGERIIDSQYASNTIYVGETMGGNVTMFGVNFADGRIKGYPASETPNGFKKYYVMYVRGSDNYGINELEDNYDGTVTDMATGLMWQQTDSEEGMNWEEALNWVEGKNDEYYLGYDDWRLPNIKELQSIVDYSRAPSATNSAAIDPLFECSEIIDEGDSINYPFYWSGTTHANMINGSGAAYIAFGEALGWMEMPPGSGNYNLIDVHGAGAQRSDHKEGDPDDYPYGHGPQGDVIRIYNYVRLVRDFDSSTDLDSSDNSVPQNIKLDQNFPNPFTPTDGRNLYTTIKFSISKESNVELSVYNILGQKVAVLVNEKLTEGEYEANWNGKDLNNEDVSSGIYLYKLVDGNRDEVRKLILMK